MNKSIVAIIPAKGNSQRVKNKNLKLFLKKPLIEWTIKSALESKYISKVCVTSENKKILNFTKKFPINSILRPKKLANAYIMPDEAVKHAYLKINESFDYIIMLQPTSPLRTSTDIDNAIEKIFFTKSDSLLSVFKSHAFFWKKKNKNFCEPTNYHFNKRPRSQDIDSYQENGAIYITKSKLFLKKNNRLVGKISFSEMSFANSIDINTEEDFKLGEAIKKLFLNER
jgi:CMP-N,N'-diacetyllegionaminic acid synthase